MLYFATNARLHFFLLLVLPIFAFAQPNKAFMPKLAEKENGKAYSFTYVFQNTQFHEVKKWDFKPKRKTPKNIILMIGDGMGLAHIQAALTANKGKLFLLENASHIGLSKTNCANAYVTDSGAGATAFSTGYKAPYTGIGVDWQGNPQPTILEIAQQNGLATGMVVTSSVTHATPASFVAHQPSRKLEYAIAADFLQNPIDVVIGGGKQYFNDRPDGQNLLKDLEKKGYKILDSLGQLTQIRKEKFYCLTAPDETPKLCEGRGNMLRTATVKALERLNQNPKGFFLMVEGSQIDWGGHNNDLEYLTTEALDFDQTIGAVMEFAAKDGETLVIVTADHETGGLTIVDGSYERANIQAAFSTGHHTAIAVPVYAFGVGAANFAGFYENTAIFQKMLELFGFTKK